MAKIFIAKSAANAGKVMYQSEAWPTASSSINDNTDIDNVVASVAQDGDTVVLDGGTYSGTELDATEGVDTSMAITLRGANSTDPDYTSHNAIPVIFSGAGLSDHTLSVAANGQTIEDIEINGNVADGYRAVTISNSSGSEKDITFNRVKCKDNANDTGHSACFGMANANQVNVYLNDCECTDNSASDSTCFYSSVDTNWYIDGGTFSRNTTIPGTAKTGGVAYLNHATDAGNVVVITGATFSDNKSSSSASVFYVNKGIDMTITNTVISDNIADYYDLDGGVAGGAIRFGNFLTTGVTKTLTVTNCTIDGNKLKVAAGETGDGGQIWLGGYDTLNRVTANFTNTIISNGFGNLGGGIYYSVFSQGTVDRCQFLYNTARSGAGALRRGGEAEANQGLLTVVKNSVFIGNRCGYEYDGETLSTVLADGGAIDVRHYPRMILENCSFFNNTAIQHGDSFSANEEAFGEFTSDEQRNELYNNVFYGIGALEEIWCEGTATLSAANNAAAADKMNFGGVTATGTITLTADPFHDTALRLPSGSPLVKTGKVLALRGLDIAGQPVMRGRKMNVGAYADHLGAAATRNPRV